MDITQMRQNGNVNQSFYAVHSRNIDEVSQSGTLNQFQCGKGRDRSSSLLDQIVLGSEDEVRVMQERNQLESLKGSSQKHAEPAMMHANAGESAS